MADVIIISRLPFVLFEYHNHDLSIGLILDIIWIFSVTFVYTSISYSGAISNVANNAYGIANKITVCEKTDYLLFIEDCFAYIEKYRYASGMKKLVSVMTDLLSDDTLRTQNDRALLLNNQASCEGLLNGNWNIPSQPMPPTDCTTWTRPCSCLADNPTPPDQAVCQCSAWVLCI